MAKWVVEIFESSNEHPSSLVGPFDSKELALEAISPAFNTLCFQIVPLETAEAVAKRHSSTYTNTLPKEHRGVYLPCHECGEPAKVWLLKESSGLSSDSFWCEECATKTGYNGLFLPIWKEGVSQEEPQTVDDLMPNLYDTNVRYGAPQ